MRTPSGTFKWLSWLWRPRARWCGRHVVVFFDSITRLARGYNNAGVGLAIGTGGVDSALFVEEFFGSARNTEDGGSLTIIGTTLVETGSKADEVIFEEFKGTGNSELHLTRKLVEKWVWPRSYSCVRHSP